MQKSSKSRLIQTSLTVLPLVIYAAISSLYFGIDVLNHLKSYLVGGGIDPEQFVWFIAWWPYALTHHINPFITHLVWAPQGYNMVRATAVPLLSLLFAPLTLTAGPIVTYNLISIYASSLSAWTAYLLCRHLSKSFWPALLGGYFFGFSDYQLAQSFGDLNLSVTFLIPLAVYLTLLYWEKRIKLSVFFLWTLLLLILQALVSLEILATSLLFACLMIVIIKFFHPFTDKKLGKLLLTIILAYAACLIFLTPFLYYLFAYPIADFTLPPFYYSNDLTSFFLPTFRIWLGGKPLFHSMIHLMLAHYTQSAYVGIPMITLLAFIAITQRHKFIIKTLISFTLLTAFLSLGGYIKFYGHFIFLSPAVFLTDIPFLKHALPMRFTVYMYLAIAVIITLWLKSDKKSAFIRYCWILLSILFLLPNFGILNKWKIPITIPSFFSSSLYKNWLSPHTNVLILPYTNDANHTNNSAHMLWQVETHMYFNLVGGFVGSRPTHFANLPIINSFYTDIATATATQQLANFIKGTHTSAIILDKDAIIPWKAIIDKMHLHPIKMGEIILYKIPSSFYNNMK